MILACIAAFPAGASAQDRPASLPTRDVDVTYRTEIAGQVVEQRSRFGAGAQQLRLDTPTPGLYMIVDHRTHAMAMVNDRDRTVMAVQAPPGALPGAAGSGSFLRRGEDRVAGLPCTEWEVRDSVGQPALTCFTTDGVMLRARRGEQVLAVATRVSYGPVSPALFAVPPSYERLGRRSP